MPQVDLALSFPGERAVAALASLFQTIAEGQPADVRNKLWQQYLEISAPWHNVAVEVSKEAAKMVSSLLDLK